VNFNVILTDGTVDEFRDDEPLVYEYLERLDRAVLVYTVHRGSRGRLIGPKHEVKEYPGGTVRDVLEL
jgi:hypothetical protein